MKINKLWVVLGTAVTLSQVVPVSKATNYSFTGNFVNDNDVQLFNFTVGAASPDVVLRAWSYAGGLNAAGQVIAGGGFDTILALFNDSGALIGQNDDGGSLVAADSVTGAHWDTYLDAGALAAGNYSVAIMQYNNFANGPGLSDGFLWDGAGNASYTKNLVGEASGLFWDVSDHERDSHWAFDILGVESAATTATPDTGATLTLLGLSASVLAIYRSRK